MNKIVCLSLVYEKLSQKDALELDNVLKTIQIDYYQLKKCYDSNCKKYYGITNPVIINKCNGTLLVAKTNNISDDLAIDILKYLWMDCINQNNIAIFESKMNKIKNFCGKDALIYLCESAVGIHSLVYGDIQVYSQITEGLNNDNSYADYINLLNDVMIKIRKETKINYGNVSIERVVADKIYDDGIKSICMFGYGKSGKLIAKALEEKKIKVDIYSRKDIKSNTNYCRFKSYDEINKNQKFDCIIALANCEDTIKLIEKYNSCFKRIYDISSPSLFEKQTDQIINLDTFVKIGKENEFLRKKENNMARNIIFQMVTDYLNQTINLSDIKYNIYDEENLMKTIELRNKINKTLRLCMEQDEFIEINTPSILTVATEGEETALECIIKKKQYFLKQSSQLLLQILINLCMNKVYDISQVFRNEDIGINSRSEFQMFSCEWKNTDFDSIVKYFISLSKQIFKEKFRNVNIFEISYDDAYEIINNNTEINISYGTVFEDMHIRILSKYIYTNYNTNIYVIRNFPINRRKFYHSVDAENKVNTFRAYCNEVCFASGGHRSTDKNEIEKYLYKTNNYIEKYRAYLDILDSNISHGGFSISIDSIITILLDFPTTNSCKIFKNIQV